MRLMTCGSNSGGAVLPKSIRCVREDKTKGATAMPQIRHIPIMLALVVLTGSLAACSWDLSHDAPYNGVVGKEVRLTRSMDLYRREGSDVMALEEYSASHHSDSRNLYYASLNEGTILRVKKVTAGEFTAVVVSAQGEVDVPETTETVRWHYTWGWGAGQNLSLRRAPWEDPATTPARRDFKDRGRTFIGQSDTPFPRRRATAPLPPTSPPSSFSPAPSSTPPASPARPGPSRR